MAVPHQAGTHRESARAARLAAHDSLTARIARGLEPALIDHEQFAIAALEPSDARRCLDHADREDVLIGTRRQLENDFACHDAPNTLRLTPRSRSISAYASPACPSCTPTESTGPAPGPAW